MSAYLRSSVNIIFLIALTLNVFCQNDSNITGSFDGASENDLVFIVSTRQVKDSCYIRNGKFKFSLKSQKGWDAYFVSCPRLSRSPLFALTANENSRIDLHLNKELKVENISGDEAALEQNRFYQSLDSVYSKCYTIEKQMAETKNSFTLDSLENQLKQEQTNAEAFHINWVSQHKTSPFSVAVIFFYLSKPYLRIEDTLAERCLIHCCQKLKKIIV